MNLINDLDTEIAFAFLVEKKHQISVNSKYVKYLIDSLDLASKQVADSPAEEIDASTNAESSINEKLAQSVSN